MRLFVIFLLCAGCSALYQGPKTDHFDGEYFYNIVPQESMTFFDFLKMITGSRAEWPENIPVKTVSRVPERVFEGIHYTFINHSSFLIQTGGKNILTDPIYSSRASPVGFAGPKRVRQPGLDFSNLPEIDFVIISHDHYDHFDAGTVELLSTHNKSGRMPIFLVGLGVGARLEAMNYYHYYELDWGQSVRFGDVTFWFVEERHRSGRGIFDHMKTLWGGFVIQSPGERIYFAGDTAYSPHFKRQGEVFGSFSLALIPIGAYLPRWFMHRVHVNPEEAVLAHLDLGSKFSIGMHFGTFRLTYEGVGDPELDLEAAKLKFGVKSFHAPEFGESRRLESGGLERVARDFGFDASEKYLGASALIDINSENLRRLAQSLGSAVAVHDFVRDEVGFVWGRDLDKASEVLAARQGSSLSKGTLFVALLRVLGVPARQVFGELRSDLWAGLDLPEYFDAAYVEVFYGGSWLKVDSFMVPKSAYLKGQNFLRRAGKASGWGVRSFGYPDWDGKSDNLLWFGSEYQRRVYPFYADVGELFRYFGRGNKLDFFMAVDFKNVIW